MDQNCALVILSHCAAIRADDSAIQQRQLSLLHYVLEEFHALNVWKFCQQMKNYCQHRGPPFFIPGFWQ